MTVPPPGGFDELEQVAALDASDREPPVRLEGNEPEATSLRAVERLTSSTSAASLSVRKLLPLVAVGIVVAGVMA